jgi:formiminotetrahydrofolate cyclodeaminase
LLNVAINLASLSDETVKLEYSRERERLAHQAQAKRAAILEGIAERLRA